ncbi:glycerophosphodiester phosphodiesterase family protein [Lacrimispora celerecrescens]|uniref:glycerophosphodiester phosphodiesterase family protein n=1 Tax=Lacrimispora celerecrescens TaxID=29354 RepID=UPI002E8E2550|nr:glycerophosphodiester phosphodiesterase family protein [Lacrimispora celerecrescens]
MRTKVWAHRGASAYAPENTLEAFELACCSKIQPEFGTSVIPELIEVLELVKPFDLTVNIELKTGVFRYKGIEKEALTGLLFSDGFINVAGYAKLIGADALHPSLNHLRSKKLIKEARKKKLPIHVWTVNDKNMMEYLADRKLMQS